MFRFLPKKNGAYLRRQARREDFKSNAYVGTPCKVGPVPTKSFPTRRHSS